MFHSTLMYSMFVCFILPWCTVSCFVSFYNVVQEAGLDEKSRGLSVKEMLQENKELVERMRIMTRPDAREVRVYILFTSTVYIIQYFDLLISIKIHKIDKYEQCFGPEYSECTYTQSA